MLSEPMRNEIALMFEVNKQRQIEILGNAPESIKETYYDQLKVVWAWQERVMDEVDKHTHFEGMVQP